MTELLANKLSDALRERMSLREFQDWFIVYSMGPDAVPAEDADPVEDIESAMAEYTGGHISREAFANVLRHHLEEAPITAYLSDSPLVGRSSSSSNRTQVERLVVNG